MCRDAADACQYRELLCSGMLPYFLGRCWLGCQRLLSQGLLSTQYQCSCSHQHPQQHTLHRAEQQAFSSAHAQPAYFFTCCTSSSCTTHLQAAQLHPCSCCRTPSHMLMLCSPAGRYLAVRCGLATAVEVDVSGLAERTAAQRLQPPSLMPPARPSRASSISPRLPDLKDAPLVSL